MTRLLLGIVAAAALLPAQAHETPIALLSLQEVQPGTFLQRWTYSSSRDDVAPTPVYPDHCTADARRLVCGEQGLEGTLTFEKLGERYSAAVVRIVRLDGQRTSFTLTAAEPAVTLNASGELPLAQIVRAYVPLGAEHILLGIDHLLFVFGLMLLVSGPWMLTKTITAFTVSHSLTLAAATFGWVGVPEAAVNAAIALSIAFVAVDVLKLRKGERGFSARYPWVVAFGFGLLHGFGFAGALTSIGLPESSLPAALLFFNIGVELGQLAFVFVVLALAWAHRRLQAGFPRWSETAAAYALGIVATYWFYDRFAAILEPLT
ncbi:MAG: HupE/UreJ family protein [Pseudomonadota bacterium]